MRSSSVWRRRIWRLKPRPARSFISVVRARLGLAEPLAPDLLAREDRGQPALLLLGCPPHHQRGTAEQQSERVGRKRRARPSQLLEEDRVLGQGGPPPAVLNRPVDA